MSNHLDIETHLFDGEPYGFIQWKGTEVCIDLHCECGKHLHYDGAFLYFWRCPHCNRIWEMGTHMPMYEVPADKLRKGCVVQQVEPDTDE